MKKTLHLIAFLALGFFATETKAQLANGSTAADFTFTDMNGNTQNLYTYLNAGKVVVIDVSATWCGPCWSYHQSGALEDFYAQYGPSGTNQAMVLWIDGDAATTDAHMTGASGSQGNWVAGTPYPMMNPSNPSIDAMTNAYQIGYFPTCYMVCPDKKTTLVDQYSKAQLEATMMAQCPPATGANDASVSSIVYPNGFACNTTFAPVVTLKSLGATPLTSCTLNYNVDNGTNQTYSWTGNLTTGQSANVTLPSVTVTSGTHSFTCSSSNPNSGADASAGNDQSASTFSLATSTIIPVAEGIENATFPPTGWNITNSDNAATWTRTTAAYKTGTASMWMDNTNYAANGQIDEFTSSPLDLGGASSASLTFQLAYQMYSDPASYASSDSLKVFISTDCGASWIEIYKKGKTDLTTTTPPFSTTPFVPTAGQWRQETIDLNPYSSSSSALIKFWHKTDYENNLYVDDINITGVLAGVNDVTLDSYVSVFPNPSAGSVFVNVNAMELGQVNVKIYNVVGEVISELNDNIKSAKKFRFDLSKQPNGMYFVEVQSENAKTVKKVMLNK